MLLQGTLLQSIDRLSHVGEIYMRNLNNKVTEWDIFKVTKPYFLLNHPLIHENHIPLGNMALAECGTHTGLACILPYCTLSVLRLIIRNAP